MKKIIITCLFLFVYTILYAYEDTSYLTVEREMNGVLTTFYFFKTEQSLDENLPDLVEKSDIYSVPNYSRIKSEFIRYSAIKEQYPNFYQKYLSDKKESNSMFNETKLSVYKYAVAFQGKALCLYRKAEGNDFYLSIYNNGYYCLNFFYHYDYYDYYNLEKQYLIFFAFDADDTNIIKTENNLDNKSNDNNLKNNQFNDSSQELKDSTETSSEETLLTESEYPEWLKYVISPDESDDWDGITFDEDEKLEKVTQDGDFYIVYSVYIGVKNKAKFDNNGRIHIYEESDLTGNLHFAKEYDDSGTLRYVKWSNGNETRYDTNGKEIYCYYYENEYWYDENGILIHKKYSNGNEYWYDERGCPIHVIKNSEEYWQTWQENNVIYRKYADGREYWYDYDEKGNEISEMRKENGKAYIDEYEYDDYKRVIKNKVSQIDKDENVLSSLTKECRYDNTDDDFVSSVKWTANVGYNGGGWNSTVNGYRFTGIKESVEYRFEKLNKNQIKVIPQNGKHWFIVDIDKQED